MAITAQKFLPQGKTGGDLAVMPKTPLIKSAKESDSIVFTIKKKIILVDDLLKGTFAEKKKRQEDEVKQKEDEKRAEQEKQTEKDKPDTGDKEKNKLIMPRLSFLDGIKNFISDVLVGWVTFNLIKFLPQIMKVLKILGPIADFLLFVGGKLFDGLVTFVDFGYKAVEGTRAFIENIFGEDGAKAFDNITGHLNKLFNLIGAIALGVLAVGNESNKQKQSEIKNRTKKKPKLKERYERRQKFKQQQKRIKRKKFFKKRTPKALRKTIQRGKITAKKFTRGLKKTPQNLTKNLGKTTQSIGKNLGKTTQTVGKNLGKTTQSIGKNLGKTTQTVGRNLSKTTQTVGKNLGKTTQTVGKNLSKVSGKISQSAGKIVTRLGMKMNTGMVQSMKGLSKMAKGVRIPIVGPILAAITSYLADGKLDKALFIGLGTALGEMFGTAIPIPILGTLIGGAIGFYIGDLLYTLFRGGGVGAVFNKLKNDLKKVFNVGKAIFDWSKMGFGRLMEGLPKNPFKLGAFILNPGNIVDKVKLIGKAFFSRDPMNKPKEDKKEEKKKTITTIDRSNEPRTMDLLLSGKRGNIEQALYNMRVSAARGSSKSYSDYVGNPKFAGDVDLIMEHGLNKVKIDGGRVTLQANANNIVPLDVNSVAKKTNNISSYDDEEETVVIKSGSETGDVVPETQTKESITPVSVGGGGGDTEIDDAHYKGS
tara:strand:- start:4184 stop:6295 length:2112 start_codon:yes stop_codon:yes gene_type:complete